MDIADSEACPPKALAAKPEAAKPQEKVEATGCNRSSRTFAAYTLGLLVVGEVLRTRYCRS